MGDREEGRVPGGRTGSGPQNRVVRRRASVSVVGSERRENAGVGVAGRGVASALKNADFQALGMLSRTVLSTLL